MLEVRVTCDGIRIDKYLSDNTCFSRSKIKKLIDEGNIIVSGNKVKSSYIVHTGDIINIDNSIHEYDEEVVAEDIPLDIVYEDDYLLVINKASGMVVHPGNGNYQGTMVNALMHHCNHDLSMVNGSVRPGIVHRIDKDTSGLLLVAKNDMIHNDLAKQIGEKSVLRKYVALVHGVIKEDSATIDAPIGRDSIDRKKMCVTGDNSKDAITHIRILKRYDKVTLLECRLETGRTHQIRVHMNYINHPVVNDPVYGLVKTDDKVIREHTNNKEEYEKYKGFGQLLHAKCIGFVHPVTHEYMEFERDVPEEFIKIEKMFSL